MAKILVVDDEDSIRDLILMNLTMVGHNGIPACDGIEAHELLKKESYDLCLLDVMLPGQDGSALLDYFKEADIPVIFLTARGSLTDRVKGLNLGAQDYIVKPFETLELLARIEVVLRRKGKIKEHFKYQCIEVDFTRHTVTKGGKEVELTAQEYNLLEVLILNRNLALTREKLLEADPEPQSGS